MFYLHLKILDNNAIFSHNHQQSVTVDGYASTHVGVYVGVCVCVFIKQTSFYFPTVTHPDRIDIIGHKDTTAVC